ncbi:helix-turn-helix transcriptional regulator [uncultured Sphingomonas sp.]|uniref:helix-turn-helix domain-containing protein n=1 Tax=uncultured Sphingomonas sp. TaxID=158754 RepID=UPI0025F192A8|nr:helix-turn-helix transcriptional regulator [uncultured Sphingomonas sp.]
MQPDELRRLRKDAGMTLAQMAEALGMSLDSISRMERGVAGYPIERRTELAARYVVEVLRPVGG